jgi:hypothetical protein
LTLTDPTVECTVENTLDPLGTLQVTKQITADSGTRSGPVIIDVTCADGTTATLTVDPSDPGPTSLPAPLTFSGPSTCDITETESGVGPGANATTTMTVTSNGVVVATGNTSVVGVPVGVSTDVSVVVSDNYAIPTTTTTTTTTTTSTTTSTTTT